MTVSQLSHSLTAAEEAHWIALYRQEPFGDQRADLRAAQIAALLYNRNVSKKSDTKKITDFLLFRRKSVKKDPNVNQRVRDVFAKFTNRKDK